MVTKYFDSAAWYAVNIALKMWEMTQQLKKIARNKCGIITHSDKNSQDQLNAEFFLTSGKHPANVGERIKNTSNNKYSIEMQCYCVF